MLASVSSLNWNNVTISLGQKRQQMKKDWGAGSVQKPNTGLLYSVTKTQTFLVMSVRELIWRQQYILLMEKWEPWSVQEGSLSELRMRTTTNWFRVQLGERLPFNQGMPFPAQVCRWFIFNLLWTFTVRAQTGNRVPEGGKRESRCHWKFSHLIRN